jgi:hypothetical protein
MSIDPVVHVPTAQESVVAPGTSGPSSAPSSDAPTRPRKRRLLILLLAGLVLAMVAALIVIPRLGPQADPARVAVAYAWAGERRDYAAQWELAGPEMRQGQTQADWVESWRRAADVAARSPSRVLEIVADRTEVRGTRTVVLVRLMLPDRTLFQEIILAKNDRRWEVVAERLL